MAGFGPGSFAVNELVALERTWVVFFVFRCIFCDVCFLFLLGSCFLFALVFRCF